MDENMQKEQFSNAYLRAVAAVAGFSVAKPEVDDDSVDWSLQARSRDGYRRSPRLELQLKCTAEPNIANGVLRYPLKVKNYDDLRIDTVVPRILVVVTIPGDIKGWLDQSPEKLTLRHCAYWANLLGKPKTDNKYDVTVEVPLAQVLSVEGLRAMMKRIGEVSAV